MEITGRLTHDASVRTLQDERKVVNFSVAINDRFKNKSGEWQDRVTYVDCSYWLSEKIAEHLKKGCIVNLFGRIGINAYKTKDGEMNANLSFHVNNIKNFGRTTSSKQEAGKAEETKEDLPF